MYRGFNISINRTFFKHDYKAGNSDFHKSQQIAKRQLEAFISADNKVDARQLAESWFPGIDAHVFISHSHQDQELAVAFAGWLYDNFKITSFIDSCVWGHADLLQNRLDKLLVTKTGPNSYSYEERNRSTTHVHLLLSVALTKMIDQCECLFFLNTPASVDPASIINTTTSSAWIYSEIATARYIEKKIPLRLQEPLNKSLLKAEQGGKLTERYQMDFPLYLNELTSINQLSLSLWSLSGSSESDPLENLTKLYRLYTPK